MNIITIDREFSSGGRELAKRLSDYTGFSYYDEELINKMITEEIDYTEKNIHLNYNFRFANSFSNFQSTSPQILAKQHKIIKEIVRTKDAIFVGMGADVLLKDYNPLKIFVYSDMDSKIKRIERNKTENENLSRKDIERKIKEIDKKRSNEYDLISYNKWGQKINYDLCINKRCKKRHEQIPIYKNWPNFVCHERWQ